ncbi:adenosylmethionine--8-amino-7-oxononanoate transaminase [Clostridium sediminicola]|uniref:adenosylmethionine--8-amino-7-oxononanoate transaminase n=1 Tax=Clostridium sediminicola TaxID=3114879 RepID=UPI0031F218D2
MIWYPYSQMKTMKEPIEITNAKGSKLYVGKHELIDSISSWWSVIHGYSNDEINEAMKNQIDKFSHIMLGGLTHKPVQELSQKLSEILPKDLDYCFFSDSGSVAVEVSLKMAVQYYYNLGKTDRKGFVALKKSYHGDTFKAMEVGDDEDYHLAFPEKNNIYHINPYEYELEEALKNYKPYAFIVEPLLQGAGGMKTYSMEFLKNARELCDRYDTLFIFDEVATGFGRTGHMFVSDVVCPDIVVLGKALTAGYIGHAVTVSNKKVYDSFYSDDPQKAFMHGPTFMGNPLACAVGLKSIEIFQRDNYLDKVKHIESYAKTVFKDFSSEKVKEVRILGAMVCIEVYDSKDLAGFSDFAYERGIFNKPFLNYLYAMPPYIVTDDELDKIYDTFKEWFN